MPRHPCTLTVHFLQRWTLPYTAQWNHQRGELTVTHHYRSSATVEGSLRGQSGLKEERPGGLVGLFVQVKGEWECPGRRGFLATPCGVGSFVHLGIMGSLGHRD